MNLDQYDGSVASVKQAIYAEAKERGVSPARVCIEQNKAFWQDASMWFAPKSEGDTESYNEFENLIVNDTLGAYSKAVSQSIKFPEATTYAFGLAAVASAMQINFFYRYFGNEKPVTLYVIASQPPGTGKSGVKDSFCTPIKAAYDEINVSNHIERQMLESKLKEEQKEAEKATGSDNELRARLTKIEEIKGKIAETPVYQYAYQDVTAEALEASALKQRGIFNVISDEATAVSALLGTMYGDGKANNGMLLKGWDGELVETGRISREGGVGTVRGVFAILAQDEAIRGMIENGLRGNGALERFLMVREKPTLGSRDHTVYKPIPSELKRIYEETVTNLVRQQNKVCFELSADAKEYIALMKNDYEPHLADGGKYSHALLRGAVGKMDKNIIKLASILHGFENWKPGGRRSRLIELDTVFQARRIFEQLIKAYETTAQSQGYMGAQTEMSKAIDAITRQIERKKTSTSLRNLRDILKSHPVFAGMPKLTEHLKTKVLPDLETANYIVFHQNTIFFNPSLK
ncbi:MAG: DUF3987 domain-containing protein [Shewanella sp.]